MFFKSKSLTLNERLDQMGPQYRAICGSLARALTVIEAAACSNPPNISSSQLELVIRLVKESAFDLAEVQRRQQLKETQQYVADVEEKTLQHIADIKRLEALIKDVHNRTGEAPLICDGSVLYARPELNRELEKPENKALKEILRDWKPSMLKQKEIGS